MTGIAVGVKRDEPQLECPTIALTISAAHDVICCSAGRLETTGRLQSIVREAAERQDSIARGVEIKAGFEGKIVGIIREAAASEVTFRISYGAFR